MGRFLIKINFPLTYRSKHEPCAHNWSWYFPWSFEASVSLQKLVGQLFCPTKGNRYKVKCLM